MRNFLRNIMSPCVYIRLVLSHTSVMHVEATLMSIGGDIAIYKSL